LAAPVPPLAVTAYTATCAAGRGTAALAHALETRRSGLVPNTLSELPCFVGRVAGLEEAPLTDTDAVWDSRNHRLAHAGLAQDGFRARVAAAVERYGAARVALVLGTSTSSIGETERAYRDAGSSGTFPRADSRVHNPHSLGAFVQRELGLAGPCLSIATACSSSAKVFASAARLLQTGWADAVVVGGVDTLCGSVLYGFNSLQLVSSAPCRPFDAARDGLSLGEAAGFALLESITVDKAAPRLVGYGESADAHHMSAPHPQGAGAERALHDALARAGLTPADVDYINLHGTASRQNDEVEAQLIARTFPARTHANSTKGWTGHALGAAGIVEATVALLALERGLLPGTLNAEDLDPACGPQIRIENAARETRVALSNSFGFGGNNCCIAFARGTA
jgi:3-oxoacyl-[acyl-carrier-protein] synthase-1